MAKRFSRGSRVAEQVRREVAELLRTELKDPRVGMVSLTDVELTPDYAHAKLFYTALADADRLTGIQQGLDRAAGFLRRELGKRIHIHTLPQLHFVFDRSVEHGDRMSRLIDQALADIPAGRTDSE